MAFDLHSKSGEPLLIASKNVQAKRSGDDLIVNFANVTVGRSQAESRDVDVNTLSLRVYAKGGGLIGQSKEKSVGPVRLNMNQPIAEIPSVQFEVSNAGASCENSCMVAVSGDVSVITGTRTSLGGLVRTNVTKATTGESQSVEIQLGAGKAIAAAPPGDPRDSRCAFTATQASQALGQRVKYETVDENECALVPLSPGAKRFVLIIAKGDKTTFGPLTQLPNAEMMAIGDRAVWAPAYLTAKPLLCAQKDDWTVKVTMVEKEKSPQETRTKAETIVRKVIEKM